VLKSQFAKAPHIRDIEGIEGEGVLYFKELMVGDLL